MNKERRILERNTKGGFTLIEILMVVVIIGILVGLAVPRLGGRVREARLAAAKADIQNNGMALRLYEVDNGAYPASLQALLTKPGNAPHWRGPYLEQGLPKDPWGNAYQYSSPGSKNPHSYDLLSYGPDGSASGDDIGNWQSTSGTTP